MKRVYRVILAVVLCFTMLMTCAVSTSVTSHARSRAKKAYAGILKKKTYNSRDTQFALHDLNSDGVPELLIYKDFDFFDMKIYTFKSGKLKKLNTPKYPEYGSLYSSKSRRTFIFYRGGPAMDEGMPFTMVEYKIKGNRISEKNTFSGYSSGPSESYSMNGEPITKSKFNKIHKKFNKAVKVFYNTAKNRKKYGVN